MVRFQQMFLISLLTSTMPHVINMIIQVLIAVAEFESAFLAPTFAKQMLMQQI
jgi:hypothetical protein